MPKDFAKTVTNTDPVDGQFKLLTLDVFGASNEIETDTKLSRCRTVISTFSDVPAPEVDLTNVAESLVQNVSSADDANNLVLTLLSKLARLEPIKFKVELPLEGMPLPTVIAERAGTLNEIAQDNNEPANTPMDAVAAMEWPEPDAKRVINDDSDTQNVDKQ